MRTNEAKRTRDKALRDARKHGHDVTLISRGGALELYGCYNCNDVMDIWDSPAIVNGPMSHRACAGISRKQSWGARMLKIFFNPVSKTYHLMRKRITNIKEEEEEA